MADLDRIKATLTDPEIAVLKLLGQHTMLSELVDKGKLEEVQAARALQWLENKQLITASPANKKLVQLDKNGEHYKHHGLPEHRFIKAIKKKPLPQGAIAKEAGLDKEELGASIGLLKRRQAIQVQKQKETLLFSITPEGKDLLKKGSSEDALLSKHFPLDITTLTPEERKTVDLLLKRKAILKINDIKDKQASLTELGKQLVASGIQATHQAGRLTPSMLKTGQWKKQKFRAYDITSAVPRIRRGRMHFENEAIQYAKRIWLDMGFKEMQGSHVQTAFWDLDVLFVPQDHPAREMQDTFYLKDPAKGKIDAGFAATIKRIHENGGKTGSTGWGGTWDKSIAEQLLLRTHTTVLSAQTLKALNCKNLPAKFFKVGKVYRNETLDWKHLFEFYQVDGIVIDEHANLQHLKGYLSQFYRKMGYSDIRMRPAHFPYTEPSVEIEAFHPEKKEWVELGGAGIFRPEVTIPLLGKDIPVLAWGLGLPRIISRYYHLNDIRDINRNDLDQLMEMRTWLK